MFKEYEVVRLTVDRSVEGLPRGSIGAVVGLRKGGGFEVEFANDLGRTVVLSLTAEELLPTGEVLSLPVVAVHARNLVATGVEVVGASGRVPPLDYGRMADLVGGAEVRITLIPAGRGGRSYPIVECYRAQAFFAGEDHDVLCSLEKTPGGSIAPGETGTLWVGFLAPPERSEIPAHTMLLLREGWTVVAYWVFTGAYRLLSELLSCAPSQAVQLQSLPTGSGSGTGQSASKRRSEPQAVPRGAEKA